MRPVTLTTRLERLPGFGAQIIEETPIGPGDVLISVSVSGRNVTVVEATQAAKARGARIIALASLQYSRSVSPRRPGMPRLFEIADLVLDNRVPIGDALVEIDGLLQRVGPSSTVTGAAILNAVVMRTAEILSERGGGGADLPQRQCGPQSRRPSHSSPPSPASNSPSI
ncbi:MAG: sugar isomerase domain-containing protein [Anaerolineae bacterium]|nr:sugar isomerase domain-containing protein [Anaerolineae bacterium]